MTTIYELLDDLRASAISEVDKGSKFERLMKAFLTTDPVYAEQFKDVWLWASGRATAASTTPESTWSRRTGSAGATLRSSARCTPRRRPISKDDVDTFLSESGKEGFVERIVVSTSDRWNGHAENAIKAQQIPVRRIGLSDLEASPIDWG